MTNSFSKLISHPEYQPDPATRIMADISYDHYSAMYEDEPEYLPSENVRSYWFDMCQDFSECYDEEWFGIMMVKQAESSVDWDYVRDSICDKCPQWLSITE